MPFIRANLISKSTMHFKSLLNVYFITDNRNSITVSSRPYQVWKQQIAFKSKPFNLISNSAPYYAGQRVNLPNNGSPFKPHRKANFNYIHNHGYDGVDDEAEAHQLMRNLELVEAKIAALERETQYLNTLPLKSVHDLQQHQQQQQQLGQSDDDEDYFGTDRLFDSIADQITDFLGLTSSNDNNNNNNNYGHGGNQDFYSSSEFDSSYPGKKYHFPTISKSRHVHVLGY